MSNEDPILTKLNGAYHQGLGDKEASAKQKIEDIDTKIVEIRAKGLSKSELEKQLEPLEKEKKQTLTELSGIIQKKVALKKFMILYKMFESNEKVLPIIKGKLKQRNAGVDQSSTYSNFDFVNDEFVNALTQHIQDTVQDADVQESIKTIRASNEYMKLQAELEQTLTLYDRHVKTEQGLKSLVRYLETGDETDPTIAKFDLSHIGDTDVIKSLVRKEKQDDSVAELVDKIVEELEIDLDYQQWYDKTGSMLESISKLIKDEISRRTKTKNPGEIAALLAAILENRKKGKTEETMKDDSANDERKKLEEAILSKQQNIENLVKKRVELEKKKSAQDGEEPSRDDTVVTQLAELETKINVERAELDKLLDEKVALSSSKRDDSSVSGHTDETIMSAKTYDSIVDENIDLRKKMFEMEKSLSIKEQEKSENKEILANIAKLDQLQEENKNDTGYVLYQIKQLLLIDRPHKYRKIAKLLEKFTNLSDNAKELKDKLVDKLNKSGDDPKEEIKNKLAHYGHLLPHDLKLLKFREKNKEKYDKLFTFKAVNTSSNAANPAVQDNEAGSFKDFMVIYKELRDVDPVLGKIFPEAEKVYKNKVAKNVKSEKLKALQPKSLLSLYFPVDRYEDDVTTPPEFGEISKDVSIKSDKYGDEPSEWKQWFFTDPSILKDLEGFSVRQLQPLREKLDAFAAQNDELIKKIGRIEAQIEDGKAVSGIRTAVESLRDEAERTVKQLATSFGTDMQDSIKAAARLASGVANGVATTQVNFGVPAGWLTYEFKDEYMWDLIRDMQKFLRRIEPIPDEYMLYFRKTADTISKQLKAVQQHVMAGYAKVVDDTTNKPQIEPGSQQAYASEMQSDVIIDAVTQLFREVRTTARNYFSVHFNFAMHAFKKRSEYVEMWMRIIEHRKEYYKTKGRKLRKDENAPAEYTVYDTVYKAMKEEYMTLKRSIVDQVDKFFSGFTAEIGKTLGDSTITEQIMLLQNKEDREELLTQKDKTVAYVNYLYEKIYSLYYIKYSLMNLIMDSQFVAIYVLKIVHYLILLGALFLTEKLFSEMYMKKVYAENTDPPNLLVMLGIMFAIDIGFILFLVTILLLVMYIFKTDSDNFIINGSLIKAFLGDYALFIAVVLIIAAIIGHVIQQKRYFRYKTEGLRAIRAYKEILIAIAGIITLVPFFSFFGFADKK